MDLKGKKIAVIGAGVEGVSSLEFLLKEGSIVSLLDQKKENEIDSWKLEKIRKLGAKLIAGGDYLSKLTEFDIIVRSPGVRRDLPEIISVEKVGTIVTSQTKLFFDLCLGKIIGVTGTKGKGTTATLIFKILKEGSKDVYLAGNIGNPPLDLIGKVGRESMVVLELSSFQLIDLDKSPHIAVVLMITSEHLDWHETSQDYLKAKEAIVKFQTSSDYAVINDDFDNSKKIGNLSRAKKYYFSIKHEVERGTFIQDNQIEFVDGGQRNSISVHEVKIPGDHNLQNVAASLTVAELLKVPVEKTREAISDFKGLPHRLEFAGDKNGVSFYDDSASTNPETTIAAIKSFKKPKIVILGGSSKKSNFNDLGKAIAGEDVKAVILIGQEAKRIRQSLEGANFNRVIIEGMEQMQNVVSKAIELAQSGDVVILSPACASFDQYKSYVDRGDKFKIAVSKLL